MLQLAKGNDVQLIKAEAPATRTSVRPVFGTYCKGWVHRRSLDFIIGGANLTGGTLPPESRRDQLTRVGFWCRCQKRKALPSFNILNVLHFIIVHGIHG